MSSARRSLVLLVSSVILLVHASVALAAPVGWTSVDVTVQSDQSQSLLLVSGELPKDTKLPYEAELAVPAGMELQWAGEILGGAPEDDPELKYTKTSADGLDIYRFTLTKALTAQIEGTIPPITGFDGTTYSSALKWTAWTDLPEVNVNQRIPQAAQIVVASPDAALQPADGGYSYYSKTLTDLKSGDVVDLTFSYTLPAAGATTGGAAAPAGSNTAVIVILVIFAGIVGIFAYNVNRKVAIKKAAQNSVPAKTSRAVVADDENMFEQTDHEAGADSEPGVAKKTRPIVPMLIVIGLFIIGFAIAGAKGTSTAVVDGKITRNFGSTTACQVSFIPVVPNGGVDLAEKGDKLVAAFEGMDSIGNVVLDVETSVIEVNWCESSQSDESVRQALNATGLVTLGATQGGPAGAPAVTGEATPTAQ